MTEKYSRPTIAVHDYFDDDGNPVVYGYARPTNRPGGVPPGVNSFSNQDRYEPIFNVADALIAYLSQTFDVVVEDDLRHAQAFSITDNDETLQFTRVVHVQPVARNEAPITIGFHDDPGRLEVAAGSFSEFDLWFCGCDACDDPWEDVAENLETVVLTIAAKGLTERLDRAPWGRARYWLGSPPSRTRGSVQKRDLRASEFARIQSTAPLLAHGKWRPWTPRTATAAQ